MAYVSHQSVLQEAGLWHPQVGETLSGTVNGTNAVFTAAHKPLVQNTDGATVSVLDVSAYVNGSPVTVSAVNATTGALTLSSAPSLASTVTGDYVYSSVSQSVVAGVIEEAEEFVNLELESIYTVNPVEVPATVRKIARFYAAGLLMSREYGLQSITEETTKEGERKLAQAEAWLTTYRARLVSNSTSTGDLDVPRATEDKRIFEQYDPSNSRWEPLGDSSVTVNRRT